MPKEPIEEQSELTVIPTKADASVEIVPFGTNERIRLSAAIVRQMIAVPTRTGKQPDDNACIKFIMLCKARHLNPFEGDAYMLGYDTQSGPQFSLITAHQVFLKRAEASKGFNGMESGVIVKAGDGPIEEREGDLTYDGEKIVGGWAKVHRKDREHPFYRRLKLSTFNTGRSRWEKDPAGMIVKCAEADALRTAFPTHLGGLYVQEELPPIDMDSGTLIKRANVPKEYEKMHEMQPNETTSGVSPSRQPTGQRLRDLREQENPDVQAQRSLEQNKTESATKGEGSGQRSTQIGQANQANNMPKMRETSREDSSSRSSSESLREIHSAVAMPNVPQPASSSKLTRKKKARAPSTEQTFPFQAEMLNRLKLIGRSSSDLMKTALENEWVDTQESWPLAEQKLEKFLSDENWSLVLEALETVK